MITALSIIKDWFKTGKKPTERQFSDTWDSFWHKSEGIPKNRIAKSTTEEFGMLLFTLNQSGTNPPEITVLHNDFTYDLLWLFYYNGEGDYYLCSDNQVTYWADGNAYFSASQPYARDTTVRIAGSGGYCIRINTYDSGNLSDNLLDDTVMFQVRIKPGYYSQG
ncbi:MAG: hypothetical protein PSV16_14630 [Flavobacterium sp.]|nr:hypothetical protein [Flavobacterium sp.]